MLVSLALAASAAEARHVLPEELAFPPVAEEAREDDGDDGEEEEGGGEGEGGADFAFDPGAGLHFSVNHTLFDRSYTGVNNFLYRRDFGAASVEQGLWYELRRDRNHNTRHYADASGSLKYPLENYGWITPGLDWVPVAQYSSDRGGDNALATIDIGPTADLNVFGIPAAVRAGISGRRVDSLAGAFAVGEYRSSVGAYGAFTVGSREEPLPFAPVYFFADAVGRQIESSSMAALTSSAVGALRIGERDSAFVYGGASLLDGREGYLEGSADSRAAHFVETPWRAERNVSAAVGYKGAQKFIVFPSAYYSVRENALEFPDDARKRDEKTVRQTLSGAISTDSAAGLYYMGTLGFEWRAHDKLFGKTMARVSTPENIDSLEINLWDYSAFDPRATHRVAFRLPLSLGLRYDYSLSRSLTEYPNYYVNGRDTVANKDDSDRRTSSRKLALEYKNDSTFRAEVFGELIKYDLVFLRQAKSSSNRTDNTQKVGFLMEWAPANELLVTETVLAEAKKGEFHFPEFRQRALQRPRYSRAAGSAASAVWQATALFGLSGDWSVKFSDYGFWYGREYMAEALANDSGARADYYAITSKSVYYTADMAVRMMPREAVIEAGCAITGARDRNYESGNYILVTENGLSVKPYLNAAYEWDGRVTVSAHLSHTFVAGGGAPGYWDFKLKAEGRF
jgi:hypothetical protein